MYDLTGLRGGTNKIAVNTGLVKKQLVLSQEDRDELGGRTYRYYLDPKLVEQIRERLGVQPKQSNAIDSVGGPQESEPPV